MNPQSGGAGDGTPETAPKQTGAVEQTQTSFEDQLLQLAKEQGHLDGAARPEDQDAADRPKAEDQPLEEEPDEPVEPPKTPAEGEEPQEDEEDEESTLAETGKLVPLTDVIKERGKKQRANERADRAEEELLKVRAELVETQRQLSMSNTPVPTPSNPLVDVQDPLVLDRLKIVYNAIKEVDLDETNEDGTVTVPSAIGTDGKLLYSNIEPREAKLAQIRADRLLREDIPTRKRYLAERDQIDADTQNWYPDLKNQDHNFTKMVNELTGKILNGTAMNDPTVRFWAAHAVYGFMQRSEEARTASGNGAQASVQKLVDSSKQKLAPSAPKTRAVAERKPGADQAKAKQLFEKNPADKEAAADYVGALLQGNRRKTVQPVAE